MAINPLPIVDYTIDVQTPFQASVEGLKFAAGREALDAARMQRQREEQGLLAAQQQQQKFQSDLNSFFSLPPADRKFDDLSRLMIGANKQQFDALKNIGDTMSSERKESSQRFVAQGLLALEAKPELFQTMVTERISAETDPNQKRALETVQQIAKTDPKRAGILLEELGAATFGKTWYEGITSARGERRTEAKQPYELLKLTSEAIIKEQEAKFAPDKFLTDLNLTKEQIEQAKAARRASDAAARKSGADAARAEAEAKQMSAGIIPVDKRPELETKFRREYNDQTKPYQEVKSAYGRVLSSEDTAVGDLSLIFGYMKMLDPGSVVREGEFATAQNAAGVPERITNIYNKVATGQRLSPSQRESFKGQAKGLYNSALEGEKTVRTGLERISKGYGLNTENIFYSATEQAPVGAPSVTAENSVTVGGNTYNFPTKAAADAFKNSDAYRRAAGTK
jgi:hypothetical protein